MITAVIITHNEELKIGRCIDSLAGIADEVIVVDSFSTDGTPAICRSKHVHFIQHEFEGYAQQKNFGNTLAKYPFILSIDADECLSEELKRSLRAEKENLTADGYSMNRLSNFCGRWIRHGGWYPDRKLRLWKKEMGNWEGNFVHENLVMSAGARITHLPGDLLHYTADTVEQFRKQQLEYAKKSAQELFIRKKKTSPPLTAAKSVFAFARSYFLRLGFLDGVSGFRIAKISAEYTGKKYSLLQQLNGGTRGCCD
jgi:glycosyltransferase involved in cell wall biosynthesis